MNIVVNLVIFLAAASVLGTDDVDEYQQRHKSARRDEGIREEKPQRETDTPVEKTIYNAYRSLLQNQKGTDQTHNAVHKTAASHQCTYNLIINEMDQSKCPTLQQKTKSRNQQMQRRKTLNDQHIERQYYLHGLGKLNNRLKLIENKLLQETVENRVLKNTLNQMQKTLNSNNKDANSHQANLSAVLADINHIKTTLHREKVHFKSMDHKLSSVMLDLEEVHIKMKKNEALPDQSLHSKKIMVESASSLNACGSSANVTTYKDCEDIYIHGHAASGVYYITPIYSACPIPVYCDMETPPGGWSVIQRRTDGSQDFNQQWNDYRHGFGDMNKEFWLGNDNLFLLTNQKHYQLRVDLWDFYGSRVYAEYIHFKVDGERDRYRLHISNHTGTAPDGFSKHNGIYFSTPDRDNDLYDNYHCAREWSAGWWFSNCWFVILNGLYHNNTSVQYRGISWNEWKNEQLSRVEMKIRPSGY